MKSLILVILLAVGFSFTTETTNAQTNRRRATAPSNPAPTPEALPVSVVLKDGQTLKGKFVSANSQKLAIIVGSSVQQINMSEVASLVFFETKPSAPSAVETESKSASREAIKALRKLGSATSVGFTFAEYGTRLIDAKAVVDESLPRISDDQLKSEIELAMGQYSFASQVWQTVNRDMIDDNSNTGFLYTLPGFSRGGGDTSRLGASLVKTYNLKPEILPSGRSVIFRSDILSAMWKSAGEHLDKAAQLAGH